MPPQRTVRSGALRSAIGALAVAATALLQAQCPNDNTLTGTAVTVTCPTTVNVPCVQGGQYVLVNVVAGNIYTFSTCGGSSFDTEMTVFDNAGGPFLAYNDDACGLQSSIQFTATFTGQVRVLIDQFPCTSNTTCIPLSVSCASPPPPMTNNEPCQPKVLAVTTLCFPAAFTTVGATATTNANIPAPGCGNFGAGTGDVWFLFIAPPTGIAIIETLPGTLTDGAMALYSATPNCTGTFTLIDCDDDSGNGLMPFLSFTNLVPGQPYYIRFWGYGTATGTFTICVHGPTAPPPSDCVYLLQVFDSFGDGWGGSFVTITVNGVPLTVVGAFSQGIFPDDVTLIAPETLFRRVAGEQNYNMIGVQLDRTASDETVLALAAFSSDQIVVQDLRESNRQDRGTYYAARIVLYGFLAIIGGISLLNIVNSISMSVSARMKQYGILRAIGMDDAQLKRMISAEAGTYAVSGLVVGIALGLVLNRKLYILLITHYFGAAWQVPWGCLAVIVVVVLAAVVLAVYNPVRRILMQPITATISEL